MFFPRTAKIVLLVTVSMLSVSCSSVSSDSRQLRPVGFDAVTMSGELASRVSLNFDRMETPLYQPARVFWTEEESGGWPADKEGRTILALVLDARASGGRTPLYLDSLISMLPTRLNERGYLGTIHSEAVDEQQLSGHGWLLRGLCEYFEWTGDSTALNVARGIAGNLFLPIADSISGYPVDVRSREQGVGEMSGSAARVVDGWRLSTDVGCVFIGMDGLIHYYSHDHDPRIKAVIDSLVGLFRSIDLVGIKAQTHASLTAMRGLLRYAAITGDKSLVDDVVERWQVYKSDGMTENFENYNWFDRYDTWTEPCAIVDSYLLAVQLWALTRNPYYLLDAEHIYYNGICATQRDNGGFGCNKPVGPRFDSLVRNCDEAHWCCTMRGGEGLGRAVEYSCFAAGDTLYLPFYHNCAVNIPDLVSMRVSADYPSGSSVVIDVDSASSPVLALRLPDFMTVESLTVNRVAADFVVDRGFALLDHRLAPGDYIELKYQFEPCVVEPLNAECRSRGQFKVMLGPSVMGAPSTRRVLFDHAPTDLCLLGHDRIVADGDTLVTLRNIRF